MDGFGGVRAAGPLHTLIVGLGLVKLPRELPFPSVHTLLNEDGTLSAEAGSSGVSLESGVVIFVDELKWFAEALQAKHATGLNKSVRACSKSMHDGFLHAGGSLSF